MLIVAELVLGVLFILNIHAKVVYYTILSFLVGFTLYLFLLPALFEVDITNCHCFGDVIVLSRGESILKNVLLLLCMVFVSPKFSTHKKWHKWVMIALGAVIFTVLMVINAPNYLYSIVHKDKTQVDIPTYELALINTGKEEVFTDGKQIICMYSAGCRFCKHAALKLHLIMKHYQLPEEQVKAIFWSGTPDSVITHFFSDQKISVPEYITFRVDTFLAVTSGNMPLFLFSENGTIVYRSNYITLNEKKVVDFFNL
jgi:hypothetical protein